jgi:AAA domain
VAIIACYGGSRHDTVCGHVLALLRFGKNGETGVLPALEALRVAFVRAVADDREGGEAAADAEFARLVENADKRLGDAELPFGDDWTRRGAPADDRQQASRGQKGSSDVVEGMPRLWNAADLRPAAQPRWLAKNRLPRAAVSLLVGDEGIGKSLMWVWLVAAVTTGKPLSEFGVPSRDPADVIVVVTEDDWATTVRPRLEVAGADLSRISVICTEEDGSGAPVFPRDLFLIREADPPPALVVVDAWLDTVPGTLSVRDPQQARQALHPWRELATMTDAAVLLLTHTNRVASVTARDKYGATGELRKKARMTLWAQQDQAGHLVVGPEKANGAAPVSATAFEIRPVPYFSSTEDHDGTVPLLGYVAESAQTAREHVAESYAAGHGSGSTNDDVVAWLASFLAEGPRWAKEIFVAALAAGFSSDKAKRAKHRLRIESERETSTGPWYWCLPQHSGSAPREREVGI